MKEAKGADRETLDDLLENIDDIIERERKRKEAEELGETRGEPLFPEYKRSKRAKGEISRVEDFSKSAYDDEDDDYLLKAEEKKDEEKEKSEEEEKEEKEREGEEDEVARILKEAEAEFAKEKEKEKKSYDGEYDIDDEIEELLDKGIGDEDIDLEDVGKTPAKLGKRRRREELEEDEEELEEEDLETKSLEDDLDELLSKAEEEEIEEEDVPEEEVEDVEEEEEVEEEAEKSILKFTTDRTILKSLKYIINKLSDIEERIDEIANQPATTKKALTASQAGISSKEMDRKTISRIISDLAIKGDPRVSVTDVATFEASGYLRPQLRNIVLNEIEKFKS